MSVRRTTSHQLRSSDIRTYVIHSHDVYAFWQQKFSCFRLERFTSGAPSIGRYFNCFKRKLLDVFVHFGLIRPRRLVTVILGALETALYIAYV